MPPKLLDPFAGGGAIPLEGLRLGCEVEASDLNPVAVLILKGTVEYPQKYGQPDSRPVPDYIRQAAHGADGAQMRLTDGDLVSDYRRNPLATDVRYWGNWMLERAREELADLYPPDPDGSVPVAYLWSRTVPCPSCAADMPLIRQYWLARKDKKKVALKPVVDHEAKTVDFEVVEGPYVTGDPGEATTSRGDTRCLVCSQVVKATYVREAARNGKMGATLTAVVLASEGREGKTYRADAPADETTFQTAAARLSSIEEQHTGELSVIPDEPIDPSTLGLRIDGFGLMSWGNLFNVRQLVTLTTFARLARDAHAETLRAGLDEEYARAVATYLGLAVDRLADRSSTLCRWDATSSGGTGAIMNTFARQALSMVWDYAEVNPFSGMTGDFRSALEWIDGVISSDVVGPERSQPAAYQADARAPRHQTYDLIATDPPYYNAIDYAGLSDFFYSWLKRSVGSIWPDLFSLPLTPKKDQAIMASEASDPAAKQRYVRLMQEAFLACATTLREESFMGVVFAHSDPDAWATLIESLLVAGLIPDSSWPVDTELGNKVSSESRANLNTSVWMACRPRDDAAGEAFLGDVLAAMRPVIRERLLDFWSKGIRGADFFISAIGPALSVFGRHTRVLRPDGSVVTVREFLDLVRQVSTDVALEQVLEGADLGVIDPVTRSYVTWVWSYSRAALDSGDVHALGLATGTDYRLVVGPEAMAAEGREKSKKVVRLRTIRDRALKDADFGEGTAARPAPLIEQLQRAAWLWKQHPEQLPDYRAQLGETRWAALRTLGQAVAECLPTGDDDRQMIQGLLGSSIMTAAAPGNGREQAGNRPTMAPLPGLERTGK